MQGQEGFLDFEQRLEELSKEGDPLDRLSATVDFEMFRPVLRRALRRGKRGPGGRPPYDAVLKFKMLVLQALHGLSLAQTSYLVRDRLSWMRFCGLGPGDAVPDEKLGYIANHWDGLQIFLTDGRVEIDSNSVENAICPIALGRKNALFAAHDEGGKNWGLIASLIGTCKLNGVNPFDYLKATLEALANGHPQSRLDDLMPWAFNSPSS